jgi:hypothetical protein
MKMMHNYYAACLFHYDREYAVLALNHSILVCIDDKYRVKIGEQDAPVASAGRGRQAIVRSGMLLQAADHNSMKIGVLSLPLFWYVTSQMKLAARGTLGLRW